MEEKQKKLPKKVKYWLIAGSVLLLVLLAILGAYLFANSFLSSIGRLEHNASLSEGTYGDSGGVGQEPANERAESIFANRHVVNVLLVGQDQRPGETEGPQQTDAIVLCSINLQNRSITLTSFLRDLWVYIPDLYNQRLNMPYKLGGFPLLNETLEYNFGIRADYIVEMNFEGFMEAVNTIGGVEIYLSAAEAEYLNRRGNWEVDEGNEWTLQEGSNLLDGSQTLAYTRISQLGTDFARTGRHQKVLIALLSKLEGMSSTDVFDLSRNVLPLVSTDMSNNQILELLLQVLPIVSELEIKTQHIPLDGNYSYEKKGEGDVLVMNKEQLDLNRKLLQKTISG